MFDKLTQRINSAIKHISGNAVITEINITQTVKEIRKALLEADVNYALAKEITNNIKEKAIGQKILQSVTPGQMITKIIADELTNIMGQNAKPLSLNNKTNIIMVIGLQGSGKTTFVSKLANHLQTKENKKVLMIAGDIHRPAAIQQLQQLGEQIQAAVFTQADSDAVTIVKNGLEYAKQNLFDTILIDTAGRQTIDEVMMKEAQEVQTASNPQETLFVLDAMIGQDAVNTAKSFHERLNFSGIVLTKMDGDSRGGSALSATYITGIPVKFISEGEKPDSLSIFHPDRMAQRILGMGDVVSLVEKAQEQFDEVEAKKLENKFRKSEFNFEDFKGQIQKIKKMGNLKDLIGMIPGAGQKLKNANIDQSNFIKIESIIDSMTPYERKNPSCLKESRKIRIAKGSGRTVSEINALIKQFEQMKKMMKGAVNGKMPFMP